VLCPPAGRGKPQPLCLGDALRLTPAAVLVVLAGDRSEHIEHHGVEGGEQPSLTTTPAAPVPKSYDPLSSIHAPSIAAPPVTISSPVHADLKGASTVNVTINNDGIVGQIKKVVQGEIQGAFSGLMSMLKLGSSNSSAGFDGKAAPATPDMSVMHGGH
jgi:hypothetical protein